MVKPLDKVFFLNLISIIFCTSVSTLSSLTTIPSNEYEQSKIKKNILLSGFKRESFKILESQICEGYVMLTNYKRVNITLEDLVNTNSIIITDKPIEKCYTDDSNKQNKVGVFACAESANLCQISQNSTEIVNFAFNICLENIYVYVHKKNEKEETSFKITTQYFKEECDFIHYNSFSYCGESSITSCRNCERAGCIAIDCGYDYKERFIKVNELCIPFMMDEAARKKRCSIFGKANTYRAFDICDQDILKKVDNITLFLLAIIVIIIICIAGAILYYNVYNSEAPFKVPDYLPGFLFPRSNSNASLLERRSTLNKIDEIFTTNQSGKGSFGSSNSPAKFPPNFNR